MIDPPEGHLATYIASLERVRDLMGPGAVLHPAHGPVASDGARVLERFLEHRQRREDALIAALATGTAREDELVRTVYLEVEESLHPIAARSLRWTIHAWARS